LPYYLVLFATWISICAAVLTIANHLDNWMDDNAKALFSSRIRTTLRGGSRHWVESVNSAFISIFDRLYGWRNPHLDGLLWRGILFTYIMTVTARVTFQVFHIPVANTEAILLTVAVTAVGTCLLAQAFSAILAIVRQYEAATPPTLSSLLHAKTTFVTVLCGSLGISLLSITCAVAAIRMNGSNHGALAIGLCGAVSYPFVLLTYLIPKRVLPVAPLRALASSFFVTGVLAVLCPDSARLFIQSIVNGQVGLLTFLVFNLFGDAVSLVETRLILSLCKGHAVITLLGILILDLVLSAAIYLVLPGLAAEKLEVLRDGIMFRGLQPWLGILFWSTFATSLLFYLFLASVLFLKAALPLLRVFDRFESAFSFYSHPARLVAVAMVLIITVVFCGYAVLRARGVVS
jgi:hypothetical protein